MIRRPRRVVPATLVALVLLAAMVLLIWVCVQLLLGDTPLLPLRTVADQGARTQLGSLPVLIGAGVAALLGIVLLVCAWKPGRPDVLPLADDGHAVAAGATRQSVARHLARTAREVDGIDAAATSLTARAVRTTVRTPLRDTSGLAEQVRTAIGEQLDRVALRRTPAVTVRVKRTRSSR